MNTLPKDVLDNLETVMYDDMCHLAKYSRNPVSKAFLGAKGPSTNR